MEKDGINFFADIEESKFMAALRTLVFEQTCMDDDGFLTKRIWTMKDRKDERLLNRDFCVCSLDDFHNLAVLYNSTGLFEAPVGMDKNQLNLWVLSDASYSGDPKKVALNAPNLSQPHFIQLYKRKLLTNNALGNCPYDKTAREWESSLGIPLLAPEIQTLAGSVFLYDPTKGISIPLKMSQTYTNYKIKMVNLSQLASVRERLAKILDKETMLVIVIDIAEIAALIPLVHADGPIPAITDIAVAPISLEAPYDATMNNCIDI